MILPNIPLLEYLPIILFGFIFISTDSGLNHKILSTCCNALFTLVIMVLLYICLIVLKYRKTVIFGIAILLWIFLIFMKKLYL
jgi:hypothetical protein